jgi:4-carboxymuconolactone decarboxylase
MKNKPTNMSASGPAKTPKGASAAGYPPDIDRQSGFRLPLPKREDLDSAGQKLFDIATSGASIAGLHGPSGIQLHSPEAAQHLRGLLGYLRNGAGIPANVREIAILAVARNTDSQFEWVAHESLAHKMGVSKFTIETIKNRGSLSGLPEIDALVIRLAREAFDDHRVTPETFAAGKNAFGPKQLIDIVLLMGHYSLTAALLSTFDVQLHPGNVASLPMP